MCPPARTALPRSLASTEPFYGPPTSSRPKAPVDGHEPGTQPRRGFRLRGFAQADRNRRDMAVYRRTSIARIGGHDLRLDGRVVAMPSDGEAQLVGGKTVSLRVPEAVGRGSGAIARQCDDLAEGYGRFRFRSEQMINAWFPLADRSGADIGADVYAFRFWFVNGPTHRPVEERIHGPEIGAHPPAFGGWVDTTCGGSAATLMPNAKIERLARKNRATAGGPVMFIVRARLCSRDSTAFAGAAWRRAVTHRAASRGTRTFRAWLMRCGGAVLIGGPWPVRSRGASPPGEGTD